MEAILSFGIDFIIRMCKANKKKADIYTRITIDGKSKEISIKEQIGTDDWRIFICKQAKRITSDGKHFHIDLVFYKRLIKSFALFEDRGATASGYRLDADVCK